MKIFSFLLAFIFISINSALADIEIPPQASINVTPKETDFNVDLNTATEARRTYDLTFTGGNDIIKVNSIIFSGTDEDLWSKSENQELPFTLTQGGNGLELTVVFKPESEGVSKIDLSVEIDVSRRGSNGRRFNFQTKIKFHLTGKATRVRQNVPPPPVVEGDEPGSTEGETPPTDKEKICVVFHYMNDRGEQIPAADKPDGKDLDRILKLVNAFYNETNVSFYRKPGDIGTVPNIKDKENMDEKCLNVYLTDTQYFEREVTREGENARGTSTMQGMASTRPLCKDELNSQVGGLNPSYKDNFGVGNKIELEFHDNPGIDGTDDRAEYKTTNNLAHEFGHALGLGSGPGKVHQDPVTGEAITDGNRLLHDGRNVPRRGNVITEKETEVIDFGLQCLKNHVFTACGGTGLHFVPLGQDDERYAFVMTRSLPEILSIEAYLKNPVETLESARRFEVEFDINNDGNGDKSIIYERLEIDWILMESPDISFDLDRVSGPILTRIFKTDRESELPIINEIEIGFFVEVFKYDLPQDIGVRLKIDNDDVGEFFPLNLRRPSIEITIPKTDIKIGSNKDFELSGTIKGNSTFAGDLDFALQFIANGREYYYKLGTLKKGNNDWAYKRKLSSKIQPGKYAAVLIGSCNPCQIEEAVNTTLVFEEKKINFLVYVILIMLLLGVGIFLGMKRKKR